MLHATRIYDINVVNIDVAFEVDIVLQGPLLIFEVAALL